LRDIVGSADRALRPTCSAPVDRGVPQFFAGYQVGDRLWVFTQHGESSLDELHPSFEFSATAARAQSSRTVVFRQD
jgi:hypothetical protein